MGYSDKVCDIAFKEVQQARAGIAFAPYKKDIVQIKKS